MPITKGKIKPDKILPGDSQKRVMGEKDFDEPQPGLNTNLKITGRKSI